MKRRRGEDYSNASAGRFARRCDGFAVVLVLVLLGFTLVLVGALATLARIENGVSQQSARQACARQNALLAVNLALAQLQRHAGPDTRATAAAEAYAGRDGTRHFTGVWNTAGESSELMTWLVSGNETAPLLVKPETIVPATELLGAGTFGTAHDVDAPLQSIRDRAELAGHYAWWVGDEGVKASVGRAERSDDVAYPPYDSDELRSRLRQSIALGAGPAEIGGGPVFEPGDVANRSRLPGIVQFNQLALLSGPGSAPLGVDAIRPYFKAWTSTNESVLANSARGGLRQDLSLKPDLLGDAFAAWTNYSAYMEDPAKGVTPGIAPAYPSLRPCDALRRRYRFTAPVESAGISHGIAPVLSYFLLTFNIRSDPSVSGSPRPLEVRARWLTTLWNPYTSAFVPEPLELEVAGLPRVMVVDDTTATGVGTIDLSSLYGSPLRIALPWTAGGRDDQQSWLSGRVYTWSARENLDKASAPPANGFDSVFYTRTLSTTAGQGVQRAVPGLAISNSAQAHLVGPEAELSVRLFRTNAGGNREWLRTFVGPRFSAFATTPAAINASTYQFTFVFRLAESIDTPAAPRAWLTAAGSDARESELVAPSYIPAANGPRPELYPNYTTVSFPDRLLDRALPASAGSTTGQSYNEDVPLYELPRGPVVSVGALQQLHTTATRPFAIGNSWGHANGWNTLFDRYFFSGLTPAVGPNVTSALPLPNSLLRVHPRKTDGVIPTGSELVAESADGFSSRQLTQRGSFNINSTSPTAWLAVLRSSRTVLGRGFSFLDASADSGTAEDSRVVMTAPADVTFYRFPFSAHETYKAAPGYAASTTEPPVSPNIPSLANTHLFRRGARSLTMDQSAALAQKISELIQLRQTRAGPFRSVEDFLAPDPFFAGSNLLEAAIAAAAGSDGRTLNDPATIPEFSSQWLTSGDIMSTLAPVLFARSDTFLIRGYGDVVNARTGDIEARSWAEARVQRQPDYVDDSQPPETAPALLNECNQRYGRRFKIISFRWLSHTDI